MMLALGIYTLFYFVHVFVVSYITNFWVHYYLWKNDIEVSDEIKQQDMKRKNILFHLVFDIIMVVGISIFFIFPFGKIFNFGITYKFIIIIVEIIVILFIGFFTKRQRLVKYSFGKTLKFESKIFTAILHPFSSKLFGFYIAVSALWFMILVLSHLKK
ncbi:MAG: hypothetical protein LBQ69_03985 [Treponema sp.]|jgi:hypothetical protein|nr:hypothetical protein [Treponema sp.]